MTSAVPLSSRINETHWAGTGFITEWDGAQFLVTSAHLAAQSPDVTNNWSLWSPDLTIQVPGQPRLSLFEPDSAGLAFPRFRHVRASDDPSKVIDIICLPIDKVDQWLPMFEPVDVVATRLPAPGELIQGWGYPTESWPELVVSEGPAIGLDGFGVQVVGCEYLWGMSGGPAFLADGRFAGMIFGSNGPVAGRLATPGVVRAALDSCGSDDVSVESPY